MICTVGPPLIPKKSSHRGFLCDGSLFFPALVQDLGELTETRAWDMYCRVPTYRKHLAAWENAS
jgi:hypothetical protein